MLDERSLALLDIINNGCPDSGYKIFDLNELAEALSPRFIIDTSGVRQCVKTLSLGEFISVKYEDEKEICACPLSKGRLAFENRIDSEISVARKEKRYFLYSMLGGAIGSALPLVLASIIFFVLGGR